MPLLMIYHRLLWILRYCLGETLFLLLQVFRQFFAIFIMIHLEYGRPSRWRFHKDDDRRETWVTHPYLCATHGSPRSEASWTFQELPGTRRYPRRIFPNQVKTRRFRAISENIEYSRTPRVREPPNEYFFSTKQRPCERRKQDSEGKKGVGRPPRPSSADPTLLDVGSRFLFRHVFSRLYIATLGLGSRHPIHYQGAKTTRRRDNN